MQMEVTDWTVTVSFLNLRQSFNLLEGLILVLALAEAKISYFSQILRS